MKVGFIGVGVVGGATAEVLKESHKLFLYDKYKEDYNSEDNIEKVAKCETVFICVPTPMKPSGEIDYSAIHNSLQLLLKKVKEADRNPKEILVVIKSTAVSGTTDKLDKQYPFKFAFNPEFLREKHAIEDMKNTDRVVIGVNDNESKQKLLDIYRPVFPNADYITVDRKTAEMIKYAANTFLASQIGIANEIYNICQSVGVDYNKVRKALSYDERIGKNIKVPGPDGDFGFGGKCFPKDLNALMYLARENMYRPYLLEEVWRLNERVRKNKDWLKIDGATSDNDKGEPEED